MFHFPGKVPVIFKRFYKINSAKFIERYPAEVIHPGILINRLLFQKQKRPYVLDET